MTFLFTFQKQQYRWYFGGGASKILGYWEVGFRALYRGMWVGRGGGDVKWGRIILFYISIFVGYSSRNFSDFDGFPQISQFLHTALTASTRRIGSKCVHFRGVLWIRAIFGSKSTKFRRLGQSVTGTCPKAVRA